MTPQQPNTRIGYGFDSHEFQQGIPLKIGGIELPHDKGLGGHSDGDVLLHAITDALLGAIAAPDIGALFPPSDPKWKGADSAVFLREALKRVRDAGYQIANVDSSLILAAPKIGPHSAAIRGWVAELLGIESDCVGLKAKTPEGLSLANAALAHVVVLLEPIRHSAKRPTSPKNREKRGTQTSLKKSLRKSKKR
jgi:2-C-methyl-D-erythritol 2,4-cyclodiphosphate synthase